MILSLRLPPIRRGVSLRGKAKFHGGTLPHSSQDPISPLTREQTRMAVIEVLG